MNEDEFEKWNNNELYVSNSIYDVPVKYSKEEVDKMRQEIAEGRGLNEFANKMGIPLDELIYNDFEGLPLNKDEFESKYYRLSSASYATKGLAGEKIIAYCIYGRDD